MLAYVIRRLLLIIPTLFGIMVVNFLVVQAAPGGPVDLMISRLKGHGADATARIAGSAGGETGGGRAGPAATGGCRSRRCPVRDTERAAAVRTG